MKYDLTVAVGLCKLFEGFRSKPYSCPAGVATIGYGSTERLDGSRVKLTDPAIDVQTAERLLMHHLYKFAEGVDRLCPGIRPEALLTGDWGRFNAITDFAYNLGLGRLQTSTLRRVINAGKWEDVPEQLMKWTRGGGKVLPGLVKRRKAECLLISKT